MDNSPVLTIGHSTRTLDEFIELLKINAGTIVVDVRTVPRSRYNPHFNMETLPGVLTQHHIGYLHMAGLGGLRHPHRDSINGAWLNAGFRGFADYMQTEEFKRQINTLVDLARSEKIVLMCAEALPWRCHRSLIGDALVVRGISVEHIMNKGERRKHVLTPWAMVVGTVITYPSSEDNLHTA